MKLSKKMRAGRERVSVDRRYGLNEAVDLVKDVASAKFDETIEISMALGVDPRHADQNVRGIVDLPHGVGKAVRVAVFARGELAEQAKRAGADRVGAEDLADAMQQGELNFDRVIASPDMMPVVGKLGRLLGPKGLMPNPKLGTVTTQVEAAVAAVKAGRVQFRAEKAGIVHAPIGKASFSAEQIRDNARAFARAIVQAKPSGAKGTYVCGASVCSTMGPGIGLDIASLLQQE